MSIRSAVARVPRPPAAAAAATERAVTWRWIRFFSDDKGKVLSEEERAKENVYIQKWERERLEKMKKKSEKEKAEGEGEKPPADKKAEEETHKG